MVLLEKPTVIQNLKAQHEGTESLAVKNTFIRRIYTFVALKTTARLFKSNGTCIPISKHLIVKTGPYVHLEEAATMRFVADNTSLPVPKVFCSFLHKNRAYIVMERIQGEAIPTAWKNLFGESREEIFSQLKALFQELRALKPTDGTSVVNCVDGSIREARIPRPFPRMGGPLKVSKSFIFSLEIIFGPKRSKTRKRTRTGSTLLKWLSSKMGRGRTQFSLMATSIHSTSLCVETRWLLS